MKEEEVKEKVKRRYEEAKYRVLKEVPVTCENGSVVLDFRAEQVDNVLYEKGHYSSDIPTEEAEFEEIWIECKGDVSVSETLEGFIRTVYAVWCGGGLGVLAVPNKLFQQLQNKIDFFKQVSSVTLGKGRMSLLNIETGEITALG